MCRSSALSGQIWVRPTLRFFLDSQFCTGKRISSYHVWLLARHTLGVVFVVQTVSALLAVLINNTLLIDRKKKHEKSFNMGNSSARSLTLFGIKDEASVVY